MTDVLSDAEYDAMIGRLSQAAFDINAKYTLDQWTGIFRTGIKRGVSRAGADSFEQTFMADLRGGEWPT